MRPPRLLVLVLALALVAGCEITSPQPSGSPTSSAGASGSPSASGSRGVFVDMSQLLDTKPLPVADIFALTRELRGRDGVPAKAFEPVRTAAPNEDVGSSQQFWTYDFAAKKNMRVSATIKIMTAHAKWWVQDGVNVDTNALQQNASFFESKIYPTDRRLYGSEWTPGIDADPRIDILVARIPGAAAGYFSSSDELPTWVNEYSAQREMIYVNALAARAGDPYLNVVAAHEFCHMIQFAREKRSSVWFDEGQAQLCELDNGFPLGHAQSFISVPDTQLNDWPDIEQSQAYYGEAELFLEFLRQHAGGDALINAFIDHGIDTPKDMDDVLRARGQKGLDEQYADFVAANAFIGTQSSDPATSYPNGIGLRNAATATDQDRVTTANPKLSATVHNYAARYVELPRTNMTVSFNGATSSQILPTDPHSGSALYWSDSVDGLDSTMTRTVDLSKATSNKLSFWTWYDIEKDYDYAYVAVSTDNGQHWKTLPTSATTTDDPNGQNLGNGYTGPSGGDKPSWIQQEADLSAYAGKQVQIRFEYVTDGALALRGFAVDDIQIPGVFTDDAESDNASWQLNGFVRSTNHVAQRFVVQLLRFTDKGPVVDRHLVDDGTLRIDVDTSGDRKPPLLAVTGLAVRTTLPVPFQVSVDVKR